MITEEYYGGLYPEAPEVDEEQELWEKQRDYEEYMADIISDEMLSRLEN
jgi:hypothetical protein